MTTHADTPPPKKRRLLRRLGAIGFVLAGVLLAIAVIAQLTIGPAIGRKLQAAVAGHLDAALTIGELTYRPPFTVHLYDVHFLAHPRQSGGGTELLSARQIDLSLAKLPLGEGPVVIERFALDGLSVHVIRTTDGHYLGLDLARATNAAPSAEAMKLSDLLRLRHFALKDGAVTYQDQSEAHAGPTEWKGLSSDISLTPRSASLYGFELAAADAPVGQASVNGTIDVDSLMLQINSLSASVQAPGASGAASADTLPPQLRDLLRRYSVAGTISINAALGIPLRNPERVSLWADLSVVGGRASVPSGGERLDDLNFSVHAARGTANQPLELRLTHFRASSAGAILNLSSGVASVGPDHGRWSVSNLFGSIDAPAAHAGVWGLTGHADFHATASHDGQSDQTPFVGGINLIGINIAPPGLAAPVQGITGSVQFSGTDARDRQILFENLVARYGGDILKLDHAQVALAQFPASLAINDIHSRLDLAADGPLCPGDLGPILQAFGPSGHFEISGTAAMNHVMREDGPGYSPEWNLDVSTDDGNLALMDEQLPVTHVKGHMLATKQAISIPGLQGTLLGGAASLVGSARVVEPIAYEGNFDVSGASVQEFAQAFKLPTADGRLPSGNANLLFNFLSKANTATTSAATTQSDSEVDEWLGLLGGDGSLQIDDGNLWALPVLQSLSSHTKIAREALTAGEAAARFRVADRTIYFKRVAVYSPALGLQGSGSETFAGALNLDIIAAPLGDWKQKLAETDIPFFSRVLSSAAGTLEKIVGSATSELLYHFRITGTREDPIVQTVPAPFITDSAANLFARMIHHDSSTKLVDAVGDK